MRSRRRSTRSPTRSRGPSTSSNDGHPGGLRDDEHAELGFELLAGLGTERGSFEAAAAGKGGHPDALHLVLLGDLPFLVDVDLDDLVGTLAHCRDRFDDR